MNKIFLDPESWALLKKWEIEHAGLIKVSWDRAYFPDMEIRYTHSDVVAYAEKKKMRGLFALKPTVSRSSKFGLKSRKNMSTIFVSNIARLTQEEQKTT